MFSTSSQLQVNLFSLMQRTQDKLRGVWETKNFTVGLPPVTELQPVPWLNSDCEDKGHTPFPALLQELVQGLLCTCSWNCEQWAGQTERKYTGGRSPDTAPHLWTLGCFFSAPVSSKPPGPLRTHVKWASTISILAAYLTIIK